MFGMPVMSLIFFGPLAPIEAIFGYDVWPDWMYCVFLLVVSSKIAVWVVGDTNGQCCYI